MKRLTAFCAAMILTAQTAGAQFIDIAGDESRDRIEYLAEIGVVEGTGDGVFNPKKTVSRAEFCSMVVRAMGYEGEGTGSFSDVSEGDWFCRDVRLACREGAASGFPDGSFRPYNEITHEQAVKILVSIYEKKYDIDPAGDMATMFDDYYEISDWARESVKKGTMLSIARSYSEIAYNNSGSIASADNGYRGNNGNDFAPKNPINRSQAADMIYALLHAIEMSSKLDVLH